MMWLKLLYFFRINKYTGYLIRMIVKVIFGMKTFLYVLLITIVAFGDAFISLKYTKEPVIYTQDMNLWQFICACFNRFVLSCFMTYQMILGDVSIDSFDDDY